MERVLFTKEILGSLVAEVPPQPTELMKKRPAPPSTSENKSRKVQVKGDIESVNASRRSSSRTIAKSSEEKKVETSSESTNTTVSAADKAIGVPRVGIGVVVLNSQDHVLIGKRKSPHGQGTFPAS